MLEQKTKMMEMLVSPCHNAVTEVKMELDEEEVPPPPYISPIYRRDFLSFLDYSKLQECRLISRNYNNTIVELPLMLPVRRKFSALHISSSDPRIYRKDGHVDGRRLRNAARWLKIHKENNCCVDLQAEAKKLDGQLIMLNRGELDCVTLEIKDAFPMDDRVTTFAARNKMTRKTARSLLHLLEHLRNCVFHIVTVGVGDVSGFNEGAFNPSIFAALSEPGRPYRVNCKWARPSYHNHEAFRLPLVKTICQFLRPYSLFCYLPLDQCPRMLELAASSRAYCSKMVCRSMDLFDEQVVAQIIEYFRSALPNLRSVAKTMHFYFQLPSEAPEETMVCVNTASGKEFNVTFTRIHHNYGQEESKMELSFK